MFKVNDAVKYVPLHAKGDLNHADCEIGIISSVKEQICFVKFNKQLEKFGWDGTCSQAVEKDDLVVL